MRAAESLIAAYVSKCREMESGVQRPGVKAEIESAEEKLRRYALRGELASKIVIG
jgi:hypothetical protein